MFREFAVTIAVAIVVSGFVSLTLTPMLCARVLKAHDETRKPNIVLRVFERMFNSWLRAYEWSLDWVLARKAMMLVVTLATLAGTVALYIVVPKGFFPAGGHRLSVGDDGGCDRHLIRGDVGSPKGTG